MDGLFGLALKFLEIDAQDLVYVGDSLERNIYPARAEGILSIHFNETENVVLDMMDFRVNSMQKLKNILRL